MYFSVVVIKAEIYFIDYIFYSVSFMHRNISCYLFIFNVLVECCQIFYYGIVAVVITACIISTTTYNLMCDNTDYYYYIKREGTFEIRSLLTLIGVL